MSLEIGGPAVTVEADGRKGTVRATRQNGDLVITLKGDNGVRTTTYRLSEDGKRLFLDVQFEAQRLSMPVQYRVTYARA